MSDRFDYPVFEEPASNLPVAIPPSLPSPTVLDWEIPATPTASTSAAEPPRRPRAGRITGAVAALVLTAVVAFVVGGSLAARSTPNAIGVATPASPSAGIGASLSPTSPTSPVSPGADGGVSGSNGASTTAAQFNGIVDINTRLGYQGASAAGTGMVLTSAGEVLTNNHVIAGSTRISVTAVDTGRTYTAHVVGTDPTDDVAVIQLEAASKLSTVTTAASSKVAIGDPVVAVGNAGGQGGTPSVVDGTVVALGQAITASDENGSNAERLTDLIEVDAPIEAGDSGGPLFNTSGRVIGMDSAAEVSGSRLRSTTAAGYAIPIDKALSIADKIESGKASKTIHIGLPGFLGVQISGSGSGSGSGSPFGAADGPATGGGAAVAGVESGTPAASIGLAAGDTITSVNGHTVDSAPTLSTLLRGARPGDTATIGWVDRAGTEHSARATLATGPAD